MRVPPASLLIVLLGLCLSAMGQVLPPNAPIPPASMQPAPTIYVPPYASTRAPAPRIDPAMLQREARELLELSQSLQPDIESVNHGLFPKDVADKLKRIEKLSKRLRAEITPH
jgi:hypothetical protein